jgi:thiol-disulfide isomerase/thioredoxin
MDLCGLLDRTGVGLTRRSALAGMLAALAATPALASAGTAGPPLAGQMKKFTVHPTPRPAPALAFKDRDGEPVKLADLKGRVLLVNYWATWCTPCVAEMPSLDRLEASLGGEDFAVVPVSADRGGLKVVEPFYAKAGLKKLPIYLDPDMKFTRGSGVRGLPTSILIDRGGREVARLEGEATWDSADAEALIRHFIGANKDKAPLVKTGG